jgi:hypothetical protein
MSWKSIRLATLVILGLVLAAVPGLVGCGGGGGTGNRTFTVGTLADFSGPASSAVVPTVNAMEEALLYYQEQDPIKGITLDFAHYDHQLNYSRTIDGYTYLKAQGMDLLYSMGPTERDMLKTYVEQDHMPVIGSQAREDSYSFPWIFNITTTQMWQGEEPLQWIMETWDYAGKGRAPKIGHQGYPLNSSDQEQAAIDKVLADPQFAGKFVWVGEDVAVMSNTAWQTSYQKFKDCDYVFISTTGQMVATFVSQMRDLGYKGAFVTNGDGFSGYFNLVRAAAKADQLYDCYYPWWGPFNGGPDSDVDWYQAMVAETKANHSDWETRLSTTGPITGWVTGKVAYEGIKAAVKDVGADKVDGDALQAAFKAIKIDFASTGNTFQYTDDIYTGFRTARILHWSIEKGTFELASTKWYPPLYL